MPKVIVGTEMKGLQVCVTKCVRSTQTVCLAFNYFYLRYIPHQKDFREHATNPHIRVSNRGK